MCNGPNFVYILVTSKKPIELERHCQNLEDELDIVKKEILKILSEKSKCSKENAELKKALQVRIQSSLKKIYHFSYEIYFPIIKTI